MQKKEYQKPEIEIISLDVKENLSDDVVNTSPGGMGGGLTDNPFGFFSGREDTDRGFTGN